MKIVETIERECCTSADLVPYLAGYSRSHPLPARLHWCRHCGQWWVKDGRLGDSPRRVMVMQWRVDE